jgi:hypothetical protein
LDEQELLLRNLIVPSAEDIENMRVDEAEVAKVAKSVLLEVSTLSMHVALLQKEVGPVDEQEHSLPCFVFGPQLLLSFNGRDAAAINTLFSEFSPFCWVFVVMTKTRSHYLTLEFYRFGDKMVVFDSLLSEKALTGGESARNYCEKVLDMDKLERLLRVLQVPVDEIAWTFAENMPQQDNGRDCGVFALEVARSRVRLALEEGKLEKKHQEQAYTKLSWRRAKNYRARIASELRGKKVDINARP